MPFSHFAYIYIYILSYLFIRFSFIDVYIYIYIHIYTHMCMHMYTDTYTFDSVIDYVQQIQQTLSDSKVHLAELPAPPRPLHRMGTLILGVVGLKVWEV